MLNLLLGDVGGTNARLEVCKYNPSTEVKEVVKKVNYKTSDYESFDAVLTELLSDIKEDDYPKAACIAMCGPILNNTIHKMHNTSWRDISGEKLATKFSIHDFLLINDFHAVGLAHRVFNEANLIQLNKNADMSQEGPRMFIGFGTGIGICCVNEYKDYSNCLRTKVLNSEGASTPLGIKNKFDFTYQQFIRKQYNLSEYQVAQMEMLIGVKSIHYLYHFFRIIHETHKEFNFDNKTSFQLNTEALNINVNNLPVIEAKEIIEKFKNGDITAVNTIKYFLELLGNAIFSLSVAYLPTGGIVLMGPFLFELFNSLGDQMEYYTGLLIHNFLLDSFLKERFSTAKLSLFTHKNEPGIKGALAYIKKKIIKPRLAKIKTM